MEFDPEPEPPPQPPPPKPSKTPSWITLGFALGALFVWSLPEAPAPVEPVAKPEPPRQVERPQQTEIEAVFADWGQHAVWFNDLTEVALWDTQKHAYAICYEVLRTGESYYFRTLPALTRPVLTHGVPTDGPLQYTETAAQRGQWLDQRSEETWKVLRDAAPGRAPTPQSP